MLAFAGGVAWQPPAEFDEFRIVASLGFGAMGQVYLAHDAVLDRPVAVKFVRAAGDPTARARALEEARAIARLQHPNVVAIHRVSEVDGHPYLVSEYVRGRTLDKFDGAMPWQRVLDIALDLARGLAAAHRRGVLHRDVKPANAILTEDGQAKLLDFGIAMVLDRGADRELATTQPMAPLDRLDRLADQLGTPGDALDRAALIGAATQPIGSPAACSAVAQGPGIAQQLIGTPMYMAPELWRGEAATRRSDLYSLGILLYELLSGEPPHREFAIEELADAVQRRDIPRLAEVVPGVDPALAAIVDRLVELDPRARFASADALVAALEDSASPAAAARPDGNPYRGLAAFEPAHASLFFGRSGETRELIDRVRIEPFVVVGGDSGTGKSSLCRAGVLPWLTEHDGWSCLEIVPGRHPVRSLAAALAPWAGGDRGGEGGDEEALAEIVRERPHAMAGALRRQLAGDPANGVAPRRLVIFVDQLEELLTLAQPDDARAVAAAIAALAVRSPHVRVLTTARSDFLSRLAMLPGLGDEMARGLYFLRPLGGDHIREVIVRPAAVKGVVFESEALVDALVEQTEHAPGGLPLLQFTLAELWDARDLEARRIRAASLTALGGVGGALSRHADRLLAGLRRDQRSAVRRILLRLVTSQGTRTRRPEAELVSSGAAGYAEQAALEVLVRGRIVVANNAQDGAYEIAHEALLSHWSTLQGWLASDAASHAVRECVEQAAATWHRMGRPRDLLWGRRQLAAAGVLDPAGMAPREAAFLAASRGALLRRRLIAGAGAVAVVAVAVAVAVVSHERARRVVDALVADQTCAATAAQGDAQHIATERDVARTAALGLFDAHRWAEGEDAWTQVEAMAVREERAFRTAARHLDSILLLDPARAGLREWVADLTFERLVRAERDRHRDLADELASRLAAYDDGGHQAELAADARIELAVAPPEARVWLERPRSPRQPIGTARSALTLPPGSFALVFEAPGRVTARLPVLLARGETLSIRFTLPPADAAPRDMVYVPPGRFLFGSADSGDARRQLFSTAPLHEVATPGYFIARHEVTFGEWIEFLEALPPAERRARSPRSNNAVSSVTLAELGGGRWKLSLTPTTKTYAAELGQRLRYDGRARRADQDWTRFPVSGVSFEDAVAFADWLDRSGRIAGARLCDEYEWERAARGADARLFPTGDALAPDDANIDVTYGRAPLAFGPDEVGAHPASRSPVGADDMAGNVWEWTRSVETPGAPIARGGCWYQGELSARSMNRDYGEPTERTPVIGLRLCVTPR